MAKVSIVKTTHDNKVCTMVEGKYESTLTLRREATRLKTISDTIMIITFTIATVT